jgi:hypothetical protein
MDDSLMDVTKLITLVCFVALDLHSWTQWKIGTKDV